MEDAPKLLKRREAKQRLKMPEPLFNALWASSLLGFPTSDGMLPESKATTTVGSSAEPLAVAPRRPTSSWEVATA